MLRFFQSIPIAVLLLLATVLEVSGDALVRQAIYDRVGTNRLMLLCAGALLLLGYGSLLNAAPVEFGRIVGLYIATLFVVWQVINFLISRTPPTAPVLVGGLLIISGGLIITFWPGR
jgi:hypothetical protein